MGLMSEYIERKLGINDLENELLRYIKLYNEKMSTYLIVYASVTGKPIPDSSLNMDDYYTIFDILRNIESDSLHFYIETPGGSGETAEEIVRFIRSKFDHISFVVSGEAKSAGTIIVLSGNEIFMTNSGSLGPIDAQMRIGRTIISAYDYIEWIKQKQVEADKVGKLNPFDATMIAQISPGELSGVDHGLKFAEDLVVEWLAEYKFKEWKITETNNNKVTKSMKKTRAEEIAKCLTNHGRWRSHGRSLKSDDLEEIGLKIKKVDEDSELSDIVYRIHTIIRLIFSTTSTYKIVATADEKLFKTATSASTPKKIPFNDAEVVEAEIECKNCNVIHKLYAKFEVNPQIDEDFKRKSFKSIPTDNILICHCGFEIDLSRLRDEIESKVGKKIVE